jgi:hypothetical protein
VCSASDVFKIQIIILRFHVIIRLMSQGVLMNYLNTFVFCLFHFCPVYCSLLFVSVCCAVSVMGHLAVDSAR